MSAISATLLAVPVDFAIARARIRFSHHVLVALRDGAESGVGEGVLYHRTLAEVARLFERQVRPALAAGLAEADPAAQEEWLARLAAEAPELAYAADTALLDLRARREGQRLAALLGGIRRTRIPITEQLFIRAWPQAERELREMLARGTTRLKLKIGLSTAADLEAVRRVRALVGERVELRVDANRAYAPEEAERLARGLADLGVLALEEPLAGRDWAALRRLREQTGLPVILDENVLSLDDLQAALDARALDVLNLKLTRVGGPRRALAYARLCAERGVEVAVGCSEELGVGMAAILHTAAALPALHSVEGVGPLRLGFDVTDHPWRLAAGALELPAGAGLGVALAPDWRGRLGRGVRVFAVPGGARLAAYSALARAYQRATNLLWRLKARGG